MLKEIQVVMLATEKATIHGIIRYNNYEGKSFLSIARQKDLDILEINGSKVGIPQHLYFLSDEEIKEGEYGIIIGSVNGKFDKYIRRFEKDDLQNAYIGKIIATTDSELRFQWVSLPTCSEGFIQKYIERYNAGKPIEKVMGEYIDSRDVNIYFDSESMPIPKLRGNEIIIKPRKDTFTREEVLSFGEWYSGMTRNKVENALDRYLIESVI